MLPPRLLNSSLPLLPLGRGERNSTGCGLGGVTVNIGDSYKVFYCLGDFWLGLDIVALLISSSFRIDSCATGAGGIA